jgi:hypothetical protein
MTLEAEHNEHFARRPVQSLPQAAFEGLDERAGARRARRDTNRQATSGPPQWQQRSRRASAALIKR